jgi:maleamate amidohydrolase
MTNSGYGFRDNLFAKGVESAILSSFINAGARMVDREAVIRKQSASAFFETGLAGWLLQRGVDTAVITGCTTSGCVRASVVDAMQHNLRTLVISDCVGDRAIEPHEANLFDMQQKYADVMSRDEFITQHQALVARS